MSPESTARGWMRGKLWRASALLALVCFASWSGATPLREYEIKAGFVYKFLSFTEWPEAVSLDSRQTVTIGILAPDPFEDAFEPVEGVVIKERQLVIKRLGPGASLASLAACDVLFIPRSARRDVGQLLSALEKRPILTVGEAEGFIEAGGMINLLVEEGTVRFEINEGAATRAGIEFRSKLLRLATRVIEHDHGSQRPD